MGLTLLVVLLALVAGRLAVGGWPGGSAGPPRMHRLHSAGLLAAAVVIPLLERAVPREVPYAYPLAMTASATLLVQFTLRNARVPGLALVACGVLANAAVVTANGAMPVAEPAMVRAGLAATHAEGDARREPLEDRTRLGWLADRIAVPIPGRPEVASAGDIAVAAGAGLFAFTAMGRRRTGYHPAASGARVYAD